ncbi:MAG: phage holin family protein [Burkholderiaceae bacterium]|nr:phage holin family protein [Burkholderiaceae bacterium]
MNWLSLLGLEGFAARWRAHVIEAAIAAEDRIDLARVEWFVLKRQLQQLVVLAIVAIGLSMVIALIGSVAVLVQFWDSPDRVAVAWILAGGWLVVWAGVIFALVRVVKRTSSGFVLTRRELQQDWFEIKERL